MILLSNVISIINLNNPNPLQHLSNSTAATNAWHREIIDHPFLNSLRHTKENGLLGVSFEFLCMP